MEEGLTWREREEKDGLSDKHLGDAVIGSVSADSNHSRTISRIKMGCVNKRGRSANQIVGEMHRRGD